MQIDVKLVPFGSPEHQNEIKLRTKILREPLALKYSDEELRREEGEMHIGAFDGPTIVGCLLLLPLNKQTVKMRQVAVAEELQERGIGKQLVKFSETVAKEKGFREIVLHARETALQFYLNLGYEIYDEPFFEISLPHRKMRKSIP